MKEPKTEHPILFSTPMVQAILEGRKTMTRRTQGLHYFNQRPDDYHFFKDASGGINWHHLDHLEEGGAVKFRHQIGKKLWVRESFSVPNPYGSPRYIFKADWENFKTGIILKWTPSIHMPKSAARIWLEITEVRVERLQDISEDDAKAEGFESLYCKSDFEGDPFGGTVPASYYFKEAFRKMVKSNDIMLNPWVWVITFKRIDPC